MRKIAKAPVVMQMEGLQCGAASLCMVLAYYGKWLPLNYPPYLKEVLLTLFLILRHSNKLAALA